MRFIAVLLLVSLAAQAADHVEKKCYVSVCRTDDDGTIWCDNQEVNCCEINGMSCRYAPDREQGPYETALECTTNDGGTMDVIVTAERVPPAQPMRTWHRRGIGGFGADGGEFEKYSVYSGRHSWDFDRSDVYDIWDLEAFE